MRSKGTLRGIFECLKVPFDFIGPAEDAAEVVDIGIAQRIQLLDGVSAAAAGAAVDQPGCVLVGQHLGSAAHHLAQRQQLCARDMAHCVLVRLPHVHSLCLFRVQQTDGGCWLDLLYHKYLSLYLLLHHLMITDIFCSSKMTFRYFRVRSKRQVFSLSKSG